MKKIYEAPAIHCQSCAALIKETLTDEIPGVGGVEVDVATKRVTVDLVEGTEALVRDAMEELGYPITPVT